MDNRRWIAFFLFTLGVVLLFNARMAKRQAEVQEAQRQARLKAAAQLAQDGATTETLLTSDGLSTQPVTAAQLRAARPGEEPPPKTLDRLSAPTAEIVTRSQRVVFSSIGGLPIEWDLINLSAGASPTPGAAGATDAPTTGVVPLIPDIHSPQREYPLTLEGRPLELFNDVTFSIETADLDNGAKDITLTSEILNGLQVVKTFRFPAEGYLVSFSLQVVNHSDLRKLFATDDVGVGIGWQGGFMPPQESSRVVGTINALIVTGTGLHSETLKLGGEPVTYQGPVRWVGIERKFFLAAVIPEAERQGVSAFATVRERDVSAPYREKNIGPPVSIVLNQPRFELEPGNSATFEYHIFAGPKSYDLLQSVDRAVALDKDDAVGLSAAMFHGTFRIIRWLSLILLDLLQWFFNLTRSYGVAIILLTILVRVVTYPLTHKSMKIQAKTMAQQAKLKPFIDEINKKYKDDPAKRNQAMLKLWKEHGVNPFGMLRGCVPMLLQIPIFIALFYLLDQAIELRGQSFLWIKDLSLPDRLVTFPGVTIPLIGNSLNILPLLMGLTQVVSSRMTMSAATDPTQRQIMIIMPLVFIFFLYGFPSGLMLYWVVTNLWQIGQQKFTNRLIKREESAAAPAAAQG